MSCYMVGQAHIDALIEAGLYAKTARHGSSLSWFCRQPDDEEKRDAYEAGEVWGPGAVELANSLHRELTKETADRVGQMLWRENRLSVDRRYNESGVEDIYHFEPRVGQEVLPVVILKALACYEYQSCEHPGWKTSEAFDFCDSLRKAMIHMLPGYDDAAGWEIESRSDYLVNPPMVSRSRLARKPQQGRLM